MICISKPFSVRTCIILVMSVSPPLGVVLTSESSSGESMPMRLTGPSRSFRMPRLASLTVRTYTPAKLQNMRIFSRTTNYLLLFFIFINLYLLFYKKKMYFFAVSIIQGFLQQATIFSIIRTTNEKYFGH